MKLFGILIALVALALAGSRYVELGSSEASEIAESSLAEARRERDRLTTVPDWLEQNIQNLETGLSAASRPLREYMGVLEGALSDAAAAQDEAQIAAVRAQLQPLRDALQYLAQVGFLR